jgi:biopolymer transport protein TolQ
MTSAAGDIALRHCPAMRRRCCCARASIRIGWVDAATLARCENPTPLKALQMNQDLSILHLVLNASLVVQAGHAAAAARVGGQLGGHLPQAVCAEARQGAQRRLRARVLVGHQPERPVRLGRHQERRQRGPMERIFASGMREFQKLRERRITDTGTLLDGARRAMRASFQREMDVVESNLSFLASVGSVSPYVGLFGTVWGIMHAFTGLANLQQVTLATVAPGIAEALVATAIGLFAAIPAVVAYNRFARDIDRIAIRWRPSSRSSPTSCSATSAPSKPASATER